MLGISDRSFRPKFSSDLLDTQPWLPLPQILEAEVIDSYGSFAW